MTPRAALAAIVLALPGASAEAQSNAQGVSEFPRWSPDGERIAFHSSRDGNFEIYVVDRDGSNLRRLTQNAATDRFPSWSPSGREIVFSSTDTGASSLVARPAALFVIDVETLERRRLTNLRAGQDVPVPRYNDTYPVWSPDGRHIAFLSDRADGWREVFVVAPDGGAPRQVTYHGTHHYNLVWAADSKRLLFDARLDGFPHPGGSPSWGIYSVAVAGSPFSWGTDLQPFANDLETGIEWDAVMAPDGLRTAIHIGHLDSSKINGGPGLVFGRVDTTGGRFRIDPTTLEVGSGLDEANPDWSPDGARIAFGSSRDGHAEIYVMNADGTGVRRVTVSR